MEIKFIEIAPYLKHPLVLVGFVLALFFGIHRILLRSKLLPQVSKKHGNRIIRLLLHYGFIISLVVIIVGFSLEYINIKYKSVNTEQNSISKKIEFGNIINDRFGFFSLYPKSWERKDPDNSDGFRYVDSKDSRVEVRVYAGYLAFLDLNDVRYYGDVLYKYKEWYERLYKKDGHYIIQSTEAGMILEDKSSKGEVITTPLKGWKFQFISNDEDGKYRILHAITVLGDIGYDVYFKAPVENYSKYQDLFQHLLSNFKLIGNNAGHYFWGR